MNIIKKTSTFTAVFIFVFMMMFALPIASSSIGNLKVSAMDGYSEENGIRGFILPSEQKQANSVKAAEVKEPVQIDTMQIVFIGLIVVGVLISAGAVVYWIKFSK